MRLRIFWPGHLSQARDSRLLIGWWRTEGSEAHIVVAGVVDQPDAAGTEELQATLAILNETSAAREQDHDVPQLSPELQILGVLTHDQKGKQKYDGDLDVLESLDDVALLVSLQAPLGGNGKGEKRLTFLQSVNVSLPFLLRCIDAHSLHTLFLH